MRLVELTRQKVRVVQWQPAFQWDGEPVDDCPIVDGCLQVPCWERIRPARVGDWVVIGRRGVPMVWTPEEFAELYEQLP